MKGKKEDKISSDRLLQKSKISLALGSYEDIFSDFDPRPEEYRSLSIDFLDEAKRAARDKVDGLELGLLVPSRLRDLRLESTIKHRLKTHFNRHFEIVKNDINQMIRKGIYFMIAGIIGMSLGAYIAFKFSEPSLWSTFLLILLEPGGWFFFWGGLDLIVFKHKDKDPELEFYRKISNAKINFNGY